MFSITLPEADGGLELGVSEAALVFEELGRALVPGPLVATFLAAPWIDGAATGETIVGRFEPGTPVSVLEHPDDLDALFTLAADGVRRHRPRRAHDPRGRASGRRAHAARDRRGRRARG